MHSVKLYSIVIFVLAAFIGIWMYDPIHYDLLYVGNQYRQMDPTLKDLINQENILKNLDVKDPNYNKKLCDELDASIIPDLQKISFNLNNVNAKTSDVRKITKGTAKLYEDIINEFTDISEGLKNKDQFTLNYAEKCLHKTLEDSKDLRNSLQSLCDKHHVIIEPIDVDSMNLPTSVQ